MLAGGDLWYTPPQFSSVERKQPRSVLAPKNELTHGRQCSTQKKPLKLPGHQWFRNPLALMSKFRSKSASSAFSPSTKMSMKRYPERPQRTSDSSIERHLAVPSMKRLGSLRKRPFFHSKTDKLPIGILFSRVCNYMICLLGFIWLGKSVRSLKWGTSYKSLWWQGK